MYDCGEFFEFRFYKLILGIGVTALIFWFFCIKTKEQEAYIPMPFIMTMKF